MGMLEGKVALITGAAHGQGRSHALRLAQEGADIVAIDLCAQIDTVPYRLATAADLDETVTSVAALGRRAMGRIADVRDADQLHRVVAEALSTLGSMDIVVANAGILAVGGAASDPGRTFRDTIDVNLVGAWNTVAATVPAMQQAGRGGAVVLVSSTQGLKGTGGDGSAALTAYTAAKHGVVGLMRSYANWLAEDNIRVNTVHPTGVETPMLMHDAMGKYIVDNPRASEATVNLIPVPMIQPADVSDAVLWLVSDQARYITGVTLPVDAGCVAR